MNIVLSFPSVKTIEDARAIASVFNNVDIAVQNPTPAVPDSKSFNWKNNSILREQKPANVTKPVSKIPKAKPAKSIKTATKPSKAGNRIANVTKYDPTSKFKWEPCVVNIKNIRNAISIMKDIGFKTATSADIINTIVACNPYVDKDRNKKYLTKALTKTYVVNRRLMGTYAANFVGNRYVFDIA